jgi:hypothetical protein
MGQPKTKLVKQFDADSDGYLGAAERKAAREYLQKERAAEGSARDPWTRRLRPRQLPRDTRRNGR